MKLIIQIPCLNEEETLPATLADLPREVDGLRRRSSGWSSTTARPTGTIEVARDNGVDHIVKLTNNKGLAAGFQAGLDACLKLGADVIVNTDADNQYDGARHPQARRADRRRHAPTWSSATARSTTIEHFSPLKKRLQRLGSWVVRQASDTDVPDTTSGFRAYNREAAIQMAVVSKFTYTLETIIQAGKLLVAIDHVPIGTNPKTRESRLFPSMWSYVRRNSVSIFRIYAQYEPLRVFMSAGDAARDRCALHPVRSASSSPTYRATAPGHVQSLIFGAVLFNAAVVLVRARHHRRPALRPADR